MSDSIKAYMDKLGDKISTGHFQSNAKELEKVMSNKETINSKKLTVKVFEKEYPELSKEFQKIQ